TWSESGPSLEPALPLKIASITWRVDEVLSVIELNGQAIRRSSSSSSLLLKSMNPARHTPRGVTATNRAPSGVECTPYSIFSCFPRFLYSPGVTASSCTKWSCNLELPLNPSSCETSSREQDLSSNPLPRSNVRTCKNRFGVVPAQRQKSR